MPLNKETKPDIVQTLYILDQNLANNPIYQPLHSGRIWHKVSF